MILYYQEFKRKILIPIYGRQDVVGDDTKNE